MRPAHDPEDHRRYLHCPKGRYALVVGRFNSFVVESLVSGAVDALVRHGVAESEITIIRAPGAFGSRW